MCDFVKCRLRLLLKCRVCHENDLVYFHFQKRASSLALNLRLNCANLVVVYEKERNWSISTCFGTLPGTEQI
ncbi:hypothetical protein SNOG_08655 [Parastagonospora nodorum SN15]|uniref:Uncharacterized protein n=1 Tax=Phaeosphaeria nodorum (strain SN15 / ATCC MYA-4574 / FGSC 10173) TaxID=321614 RepID=Q0UHV9_PHANO|nr:hypothetical protein SNOG_08655 [Parastagonospora nodorum SN15]EAT83823.1 hypothetical protein SNOG_08655 [Parastagonospora nodorum SN15]